MSEKTKNLFSVLKSGFLKSVITRVLAIFIVVSIIIVAVVFAFISADIRKNILADRQKQLEYVESTISDRMAEVASVAYNIGKDPAFYLEPVDDSPNSGREMSEMLARYLVGNNFIEHLAYCRSAEPDKIYICTGERSLSEFFITSFGMDEDTANAMIEAIHKENKTSVRLVGSGDNMFFSYAYPLPQLSANPKAHIIMLISVSSVRQLFDTMQIGKGGMAAYDATGNLLYCDKNFDEDIDLTDYINNGSAQADYKSPSGQKYVLQKVVSETNGWKYVSVMRNSDTLSGIAGRQMWLIAIVFILLFVAIIIMLASIVYQYKPISNLAAQVAGTKNDADIGKTTDERTLLSDTIASLQDDSEQKQKYETAFYEAEAASKAKSAFLSSMSHDIRTPMNAIIGMTAIARSHIDNSEYVDECLKKVQVSSNYLLDIINNVLDMSRIESGRIPIAEEPLAIPALVDSVVSLMTSSVEAKSQTLEVDIGKLNNIAVLGDSVHIIQVFVNIISNAIKFTPEGGKITIRVRQLDSDDETSGSYRFEFTDTGIGIPPEFIGKVFDTFSRANGYVSSKTEGTGLGMAIAKKLVELMNGTITCESEVGHGSTFTVILRMKYSDEGELTKYSPNGSSSEKEAPALTGKRILLVEDNDINREIANNIISETGATIEEANNGKEALDAFLSHTAGYYDLIFMDIQMPVMNGYEATAAIRNSEREDSKTVPIYAMTANTFDEDVRQVRDAGMNGHIGKPYSPKVLYSILSRVFG